MATHSRSEQAWWVVSFRSLDVCGGDGVTGAVAAQARMCLRVPKPVALRSSNHAIFALQCALVRVWLAANTRSSDFQWHNYTERGIKQGIYLCLNCSSFLIWILIFLFYDFFGHDFKLVYTRRFLIFRVLRAIFLDSQCCSMGCLAVVSAWGEKTVWQFVRALFWMPVDCSSDALNQAFAAYFSHEEASPPASTTGESCIALVVLLCKRM